MLPRMMVKTLIVSQQTHTMNLITIKETMMMIRKTKRPCSSPARPHQLAARWRNSSRASKPSKTKIWTPVVKWSLRLLSKSKTVVLRLTRRLWPSRRLKSRLLLWGNLRIMSKRQMEESWRTRESLSISRSRTSDQRRKWRICNGCMTLKASKIARSIRMHRQASEIETMWTICEAVNRAQAKMVLLHMVKL